MKNGFPELAALSAAIHSDTDALDWLLNNGYPEFAVLSNAIDNEPIAIAWLRSIIYTLCRSLLLLAAKRTKLLNGLLIMICVCLSY
jgi:hypothetical protein